ncbi:aspartyl/asparaginyl beta-hydroxylase domain-containing protein [Burkholderia plantarii]|nr:aspartyl/asparaginyl beta-hydroxylase domain-containing protein [Burkholderia plantarii]
MPDRSASFCRHAPEPASRPAFYPLEQFPRLAALAAKWEIIRDERQRLDAPMLEIDRVGKSHLQVYAETVEHIRAGGEYGWLKGWGEGAVSNADWTQYGLAVRDQPIPFAASRMPGTLQMLEEIAGIKVCALSRMLPNTLLNRHRHPELHDEGMHADAYHAGRGERARLCLPERGRPLQPEPGGQRDRVRRLARSLRAERVAAAAHDLLPGIRTRQADGAGGGLSAARLRKGPGADGAGEMRGPSCRTGCGRAKRLAIRAA